MKAVITVISFLLGRYTYMHTLREETKVNGQVVEVRTNLLEKDYEVQRDKFSLSNYFLISSLFTLIFLHFYFITYF